MTPHAPWLKDAIVFLVAAGIIVPFFHRARIGAVLGFLIVGVVVGPFGLGGLAEHSPWIRFITISDPTQVEPFGELGVIFLLFILGLELSFERLWSMRRYVLGVGAAQVAASALALAGIASMLGADFRAAVVLGACLSLSSTAVVMQLLAEQHRTATSVGRISLSVLLFQDLMVAPILFVTGVLGREGGGEAIALGLARAVVEAALAVALISVAGRYLLRPLLRFVGKTGSRDLIIAITLLIVAASSTATGASGLSSALGAFLAGLLLSETEYRHHIEVDLDPFKGLLLGLFFVTVGMSIDPRLLLSQLGWIVAAGFALMALKTAILYAAARAFKVRGAAAGEVALLLAQGGEFAFVVLGISRATGILAPGLAQFATAVVGVTMAATPLVALLARAAGRLLDRAEHASQEPDAELADLQDHVIIGGFGRVGRMVARLLDEENVPYVALDANGALVSDIRQSGQRVYFGDASRGELLERAGARRARAVVVTIDDYAVAERMVSTVASRWPGLAVIARAKDASHAARLISRGACDVIPEAVEASLQLAGRVLEELDLPADAVSERLALIREEEREKLRASTKSIP